MQESIVFLLRVQCRRKKKFTFAISSPDEFLVLHSSLESVIKISGFLAAIKLTDKSG